MSFIFSKRGKRMSWQALGISCMLGLMMVLAACGSSGTATGSNSGGDVKATVAAPKDLITGGTLTVGSDTTYPPQEYVDTASGQATGFDVDLITEMAKRMGLKANVKKANFDTIIDDLSSKRYDVVISAVTINPDRQKKAQFIPYFNAGQSLLVQKGNPDHISSVKDLCGKKVGVQTNTVEFDALTAAKKDCTAAGKPTIALTVLDAQTDVIQLLADKRVDATYQDSPVTDYYLKLNPGQFEIGGAITDQAPEGIVVRKDDTEMFNALKAAYDAVKKDGTYDKLFDKWQLNSAQKVN
ncbi:ABC transporter substrate-binding protein [Ktedonobacter sp. SOSP1-52]|uniref:ABC transporter substrate-binding protein n=1 Tax=Ktedonobacter sp. SOSP1-52 TaxID=2778366 RepID=UPI0019164E06|nr:ABC transporter substrate-binding protein [Ktedonobacter sp. SOSP1-52]GHO64832.1 ABC transporter substrate-binding protein [Ktedonobacter sp. SOSP1-52]